MDILQEFKDSKAILSGHFILSSGLHSDTYMQCARVLMNQERASKLSSELAKKITEQNLDIDLIIGPAMGGVIISYELGRHLKIDSIFCERVNGEFEIRRGFEVKKGQKILIVEDVVTTGKSSLEVVDLVEKLGAEAVAIACLVNRGEEKNLKIPVIPLVNVDVRTFTKNQIPDDLKNIEAVKPGSRWINK